MSIKLRTRQIYFRDQHGNYVPLPAFSAPSEPPTDEQVQEAVKAYFDNNPIEEAVDSVARESILQMSESVADIAADLDELDNNKVGFEDYAKSDKGGVVKVLPAYGAYVGSTGILTSSTKTKEQYSTSENATFICKGTLENVKSDIVRRALTDDTQAEWTEEEKASAIQRMGALSSDTPLFSGDYNDLDNKPTVPEAVTDEHINSLIDDKIGIIDSALQALIDKARGGL